MFQDEPNGIGRNHNKCEEIILVEDEQAERDRGDSLTVVPYPVKRRPTCTKFGQSICNDNGQEY